MSSSSLMLALLGIVVLAFIIIYNRLVGLRQARRNAYADIDVQLKQRLDLVPNLVETVKGYAGHEKGVLENVTAARARAMNAGNDLKERSAAESAMGAALANVLAVAENYPDLRASGNFLDLQNQLADLENKIAAARRYFNNATAEYNASVQAFPALLVARSFGFREEEFLEFEEATRVEMAQPPKVAFN